MGLETNSITPASNGDVVAIEGESGFKFPRVSTVQRDALTGIENGVVVYNTTDEKFQGYENGAWVNLAL